MGFGTLLNIAFLSSASTSTSAAETKTRNVILVSIDGVRWQEVFRGAEEALLNSKDGGVKDVAGTRVKFWREDVGGRRAALFPFLWGAVAREGRLLGNRDRGSFARAANGKNFSYPGYSEFLTGVADPSINSNNKVLNRHTNVFEWLQTRPGFTGRVAAVVNWDVIPWILNAPRAGFPIWSGQPQPEGSPAPWTPPAAVTTLLEAVTPLWNIMHLDAFASEVAMHYVTNSRPRAFYLALGEPDEWAHAGRYDLYLHSAHRADRLLERLWTTVQSIPDYREQTTLVITPDHGRGSGPVAWKNHGQAIAEAAFTWLAVIGPDTPAAGEVTDGPSITLAQIPATLAAFLGEDFNAFSPAAGRVIDGLLSEP